jgi:hypothetical protein
MSITEKTKRLLLSKSGGFCANPGCHEDLFQFFNSGKISSIEELAHIIGQSEKGPRGKDVKTSLSNRDEYNNIIILCPNCHSKIDKSPDEYPEQRLKDWKSKHEEKINDAFHIKELENKNELKNTIDKISVENKSIFDTYGPNSEESKRNPYSDYAKVWKEKALTKILPNNRKIVNTINANYKLLLDKDKEIFERYKRHVEDFEYNNLSDDKIGNPQTFPDDFHNIFKDE